MNQLEFDGNGIEIEEVSVAGWIGTKFPWTEPQKQPNPDRPKQKWFSSLRFLSRFVYFTIYNTIQE